ncbi:MAG: TolC family protein, partial [Deltaproteobacteria bacterium]|nr:TolC family protein [Deltaproteobacteria bacterium]
MTQILRPMLIVRSIWLTVVLFSLPLSSKTISLDEAISMGKGQALDSKLLPERLNQINAQFDQALSAYLPRLKAEAVGTFNFPTISFPSQSGPTIQIQPAEVLDAKLSLQQPLINMESISLINSAVLQRKITKASTQNTERNVELRVIQAYLSTLNAQAQIQMQQNRLSRALKQNKWLLGRQKSGQARSTDLARMSAEVDLAHMQLTQAEDSYSAAVTILGLLIGERDNFDLQENTKLPAISCKRPDLKAQKLTVKFAKNQLNATRWSFWPEINLSLQGIYTTNTAGFVNQPLRGAVLLQASWTIFDGYFRFGQLKEK